MKASPPGKCLKSGLLLAAALSATALWVRYAARKAEQRFPPAGKFIEIDGVRLHYLEAGTGPAVLLLHGNGAQAADFVGCGLLEALGARYRVVAIDRPGFGYSERHRDRLWTPGAQAALLQKACAALGLERPVVLGHSFGTQVALALALDTPLAVRGLVLVSGYYFPTPRLDSWLLSPPAIPLLGDVLRYTLSPLLGKLLLPLMLRRVFSPREVSPRFLAAVPPPLTLRPWQMKASAEDGAFMIPAAAALSRRYWGIACPVAILAGAGDKYASPHYQSSRLHARLPGSTLRLLPGQGHMLHYGACGEIVEAIDRLAATDSAASPA